MDEANYNQTLWEKEEAETAFLLLLRIVRERTGKDDDESGLEAITKMDEANYNQTLWEKEEAETAFLLLLRIARERTGRKNKGRKGKLTMTISKLARLMKRRGPYIRIGTRKRNMLTNSTMI